MNRQEPNITHMAFGRGCDARPEAKTPPPSSFSHEDHIGAPMGAKNGAPTCSPPLELELEYKHEYKYQCQLVYFLVPVLAETIPYNHMT